MRGMASAVLSSRSPTLVGLVTLPVALVDRFWKLERAFFLSISSACSHSRFLMNATDSEGVTSAISAPIVHPPSNSTTLGPTYVSGMILFMASVCFFFPESTCPSAHSRYLYAVSASQLQSIANICLPSTSGLQVSYSDFCSGNGIIPNRQEFWNYGRASWYRLPWFPGNSVIRFVDRSPVRRMTQHCCTYWTD